MRAYLSYLTILLVLFSCQSKKTEIKVFKNIPLLISKEQFGSTVDSIRKADRSFSFIVYHEMKWVRFVERTRQNDVYYGFLIPSFDHNLMDGLTIYFSNDAEPSMMYENLYQNGTWLLTWVDKNQNTIDLGSELQAQLSSKYGNQFVSDTVKLSDKVFRYTSSWEKEGLKVQLIKDTDNYPYSAFAIYKIVYKLSEEFKKENQSELKELQKQESRY